MNGEDDLLEHAKKLLMDGRYAEARSAFERFLALNGRSGEGWYAYMTLLLELDELDEAIAAARNALAELPAHDHETRHQVWMMMGVSFTQLGDRAGAEDAFRRALEEKPTPEAWLALSQCLADGCLLEEIICLENALQLDPGHAEANYRLGLHARTRNQRVKAERYFRRAVKNDRKESRYRIALAQALLRHPRRIMNAFNHLYWAVQFDRSSGEAWLAFADVVARVGNLKAAAKNYRRALRLMPDSMAARWHYGLFFAFQVRNLKRARQELYRAAAMSPEQRDALQAVADKWLRVAREEKQALREYLDKRKNRLEDGGSV